MFSRMSLRKMGFLALFLGLLLVPAVASAWWTGWVSPNFNGSYSPTAYKYGQYDSTWNGGTEVFAAHMKWNQARANGVRWYSNNRHTVAWCYKCYAYYTHDHTDMSNRLHASGYSTNFPSPKIDSDDDNYNGRHEEYEVTAVNSSFPTANAEYYFYTYFARRSKGNGVLYQTPAVSMKPVWSSEYQTHWNDKAISLGYYSDNNRSNSGNEGDIGEEQVAPGVPRFEGLVINRSFDADPVGEVGSSTSYPIPNSDFQMAVTALDGPTGVTVDLIAPMQTSAEIEQYRAWAGQQVLPALRAAGMDRALATVTFNRPIPMAEVEALMAAIEGLQMSSVKAIVRDVSNPDANSNVWTFGVVGMESNDVRASLDGLIADVANNAALPAPAEFQTEGLVALSGWMSIDDIERLNESSYVYLADASATYIRFLVQESAFPRGVPAATLLPDGISAIVYYGVDDLYVERANAEAEAANQ